MIISHKGITLFADGNHICNIQATIDASLFTSYNFDAGGSQDSLELRLCVDVKLMADCFNAVSAAYKGKKTTSGTDNNSVKCFMNYNGEGTPFVVEFEDNVLSEVLEFATFYSDILYPYDAWERSYDTDDDYGLILNHSEVQFEIILKSDAFYQVLRDLEQVNTLDVFLIVSNQNRYLGSGHSRGPRVIEKLLQFVAKGSMGHLKHMYPPEKSLIEKLNLYQLRDGYMEETQGSMITSYNYSILKNAHRATKLSSKCKIRKDIAGTLSIQLLCRCAATQYLGTLITFNMTESASDPDAVNSSTFSDMFDDDYQLRGDGDDDYQDLGTVKPTYDMFRHSDDSEKQEGIPLFF